MAQKELTNVKRAFDLQAVEYDEALVMQVTVPANQNTLGQILISGMGDFQLGRIEGRFDTLYNTTGSVINDTGVSYLTGKLYDGGPMKQLFGDYVPLEIFLSPGRTRSAAAANNIAATDAAIAPVSNPLFYPFLFKYTFPINGYITMDFKNSSNAPLNATLMFIGRRLRQHTTSGAQQ